jgi:hypothetical protein
MNRKSSIFAALMFVIDFLSALFKELKKRNVSEERIFDALKSKNGLIPKMAERIADLISGAGISIQDFFSANGPVKLWLSDNLKNWILSQKFELVLDLPESRKCVLPKEMNDVEIMKEFKIVPYHSISELLTTVQRKISGQPNGEGGDLLNNGYANLFYLELNGRVVVARVFWYSDDREWRLSVYVLGVGRWNAGRQVFSRS